MYSQRWNSEFTEQDGRGKKTANLCDKLHTQTFCRLFLRPAVLLFKLTNVFYDTWQFLKIMDLYRNFNKNNIFLEFSLKFRLSALFMI